VTLASVEGFVQGIKFPPGTADRAEAFLAHGWEAKHFGDKADRAFAWWNGEQVAYGSDAHHRMIGRAIRAKFAQNGGLQLALRATDGLRLTHSIGVELPTTSLPASVFCAILNELRDELLKTGTIAPA